MFEYCTLAVNKHHWQWLISEFKSIVAILWSPSDSTAGHSLPTQTVSVWISPGSPPVSDPAGPMQPDPWSPGVCASSEEQHRGGPQSWRHLQSKRHPHWHSIEENHCTVTSSQFDFREWHGGLLNVLLFKTLIKLPQGWTHCRSTIDDVECKQWWWCQQWQW